MPALPPARSALGRAVASAVAGATLLLTTTVALAPSATAAPNPQPGSAHGNAKVFPTQDSWRTQHGSGKSNKATLAAGSGPLSFGGGVDGIGVTTGPPKTYLVVYGSQ